MKNSFLLYRSTMRPDLPHEELVKILQSSRKNNPHLKITGLLITRDDRFLQFLEGPESSVDAIYERITNDSRHTKLDS